MLPFISLNPPKYPDPHTQESQEDVPVQGPVAQDRNSVLWYPVTMATQFIYNSEDLIQQSADVKAY